MKRKLFKRSFVFWRKNLKILLIITSLVSIPIAIINQFGGNDPALSSYLALANMFMNIALIWTIIQLESGGNVTIRHAYFEGTSCAVRFFIVASVLALQFIPAAIGLVIYYIGTTSGAVTSGLVERLLLAIIALVVALPSIVWLCKSIFAPYITVSSELGPWASIKRSKQMAKGHFWYILRSIIVVTMLVSLLFLVPSIVVAILASRNISSQSLANIAQAIITIVSLPFLHCYIFFLYKGLSGEQTAR